MKIYKNCNLPWTQPCCSPGINNDKLTPKRRSKGSIGGEYFVQKTRTPTSRTTFLTTEVRVLFAKFQKINYLFKEKIDKKVSKE